MLKMFKLDKTDRKIISELDKNSRLSYSQMASRVKTSKEVVAYRVQRLIKESIVTKFVTFFSLGKISFFNYKIYFQFHGLDEKSENEVLGNLNYDKDVIWIAKCEGRWDLMVSYYARNIKEFSRMKNKFFEKYAKYVQEYVILINDDAFVLHRGYILSDKPYRREMFTYIGEPENLIMEEKDKKILKLLAQNARMPIIEISRECSLDQKTISSRIKKFQQNGLIQFFTIGLNLRKLNIFYFKIFIYLSDLSKQNFSRIVDFCRMQPNVIHLILPVGPWELELEMESENPNYVHDISKELRNRFPDIIKKIESVSISEEPKLVFFPQNV